MLTYVTIISIYYCIRGKLGYI